MKNEILVMSLHTSDEALGCEGIEFKHKINSDKIHSLDLWTEKNFNYYK